MSQWLKRWWWAPLAVAVGVGVWRLHFDVDILDLLPPKEPTVRGLKLYQEHFTNARELVITLRAPDSERAERLAQAVVARLRQETKLVAEASWRPPWLEDPAQMGELLGCFWLNQPPEVFGALTNRLSPQQLESVLAQTKEELRTSLSPMDLARRAFDPFNFLELPALTNLSGLSLAQARQVFASSEGNFRLLSVQSAVELESYRSCERWLQSIQSILAGERTGPAKDEWAGVVVRYTGRPVFVVEIARSMQRDMSGSVIGTSVIIALLFWLMHRRWLPLLWLLTLLALILGATLALGALVLGTISVVSLGFAAILLGLAVDYAVVHYQEALAHPQLTVPEIRRAIAPSILWAAVTTMSAFLVLNLGGLPGLAQLGTLVAIGVGLAALVMVMIYLPPLFPERRKPPANSSPAHWLAYFVPPSQIVTAGAPTPSPEYRPALVLTVLILLAASAMLCLRRPGLDRTGNALRLRQSEAESALNEIKSEMGLPPDPLWLIVSGREEIEVGERLRFAEALLRGAVSNRLVGGYLLPTPLWPRPEFQAANRQTAALLGQQGPRLRAAALNEGFNTNALGLTEQLVQTWASAGASHGVLWPANQASRWLLRRFVAHAPGQWLALGLIYPATNRVDALALADLSSRLARNQAFFSGWELLGTATLRRVQAKMWLVVAPMVVLVLASLWLAFRRPAEMLLGLGVLGASGLCLLAVMALASWSWNLLNLMALPLMLGTGVDYTIFVQLALRRHGGDLALVRRSVGRALLLCGGTAVAGFGSLGLSSNPGMASLGRVCAVGIGANMLFSVFLLPAWWAGLANRPRGAQLSTPPSLYRAGLWKVGLALVRLLPAGLVNRLCMRAAKLHGQLRPERRRVVERNMLPVCGANSLAASKVAREVYRSFGRKLADLWRVESGVPVRNWITHPGELQIIQAAYARRRGVLFVTLHLGNWEHGGLLLAELGIRLTVLTLAEPGAGLTELRIGSRARWGIDTLLIGQDGFALVEVIKRLEAGAAIAIAIDRPAPQRGVQVQFFGQPFAASPVAAELARASGCALVGATIVRHPAGFAVRVLPEFVYDRQALGNREARRQLTQDILRAFEPQIREHLDQWYQFIPLWSKHP